MKCKNCNTEMICDETKILTSYPPKKEYKCPNCGSVDYEELSGLNTTEIYNQQKRYLQGWVCPKCGAVMSPYQNTCTNCIPPQKLNIWC